MNAEAYAFSRVASSIFEAISSSSSGDSFSGESEASRPVPGYGGLVDVALSFTTVPQEALLLENAEDHAYGVVAVLVVEVPGDVSRAGLTETVYGVHDLSLAATEATVELLG